MNSAKLENAVRIHNMPPVSRGSIMGLLTSFLKKMVKQDLHLATK